MSARADTFSQSGVWEIPEARQAVRREEDRQLRIRSRWEGVALTLAALIVCMIVMVALTGCTAKYEADNGPRGPERVQFGPPWNTDANPCDAGCSPGGSK